MIKVSFVYEKELDISPPPIWCHQPNYQAFLLKGRTKMQKFPWQLNIQVNFSFKSCLLLGFKLVAPSTPSPPGRRYYKHQLYVVVVLEELLRLGDQGRHTMHLLSSLIHSLAYSTTPWCTYIKLNIRSLRKRQYAIVWLFANPSKVWCLAQWICEVQVEFQSC